MPDEQSFDIFLDNHPEVADPESLAGHLALLRAAFRELVGVLSHEVWATIKAARR